MSDQQWTTIAEARTKMIFDADGDAFEGFYEGPEEILNPNTGETYPYLNFRDSAGEGRTTSASYQLARAFANVAPGTYCKITRLSQTATAKGHMTNFRVQTQP